MISIQKNVSLKNFTTFGIDVKASYLVFIHHESDLQELLQHKIYKKNTHRIIIGGGSNLLLTQDIDGLVIINKLLGKTLVQESDDFVQYDIASGENRNDIVWRSIKHKYLGIENLVSIPGTIGAAPVQNIGAYGVEAEQVIVSVKGIDMTTGIAKSYLHPECQFNYRSSIFKTQLKASFFITQVTLQLSKQHDISYDAKLSYGDILQSLIQKGYDLSTIQDKTRIRHHSQIVAETIAEIRASKLPDRTKLGTAGSFFANPILQEHDYAILKKKFPDLVGYPTTTPGWIKMSAGQLIEYVGLKGYRKKDAGVYERHALILVNHGNASGEEMKDLVTLIQDKVKKQFGIDLIPEVNIV